MRNTSSYKIVSNILKTFDSTTTFLSDQVSNGNSDWSSQIEEERGQFDLTDSLKRKKHTIKTLSAKTSLPLSNTLELQWNNTLIRKTPDTNIAEKNREQYSYNKVAWFNVSQGYDLHSQENNFRNKLTRLHLTGGIRFNRASLSLSDYYFYDSRKHISALSASANLSWLSTSARLNYDPFTTPRNKRIQITNNLKLSDLLTIGTHYDYDIEHKRLLEQGYKIFYIPSNNCWGFELGWNKTILETRFSFNFFINFGQSNFQPLSKI